jgi:hypothetical protein
MYFGVGFLSFSRVGKGIEKEEQLKFPTKKNKQ